MPAAAPTFPACRLALAGAGILAALALAAGSADARPSASGPWVVKDLGKGKGVVAGYRVPGGRQRYGDLIRSWGTPARQRESRAECVATWTRPSAQAIMRTVVGVPPGRGWCDRHFMYVSTIKTIGPKWRTDRGLRIGDLFADIIPLYPNGFVWLDDPMTIGLRRYETTGVFGEVTIAGAYARINGGRVRSFWLPVGAEGE